MAKTINICLYGEKTQASGILSFSMQHQLIIMDKIKQFQTRDVRLHCYIALEQVPYRKHHFQDFLHSCMTC
jgi:hypothetical protein